MPNKSRKKSCRRLAEKAPRKKTNLLPIFAVAAIVICAAVVYLANGNEDSTKNDDMDHGNSGVVAIASGESLVIPTSDITTDASFYLVDVNGTNMEVIAVRDSAGNIRTALNTCQICYDSGRGYYVQSGNFLVCQNCGNRFSMDQVGMESGGCNPWPIFAENKTVTADEISISYDFLVEAQGIFANWKGND